MSPPDTRTGASRQSMVAVSDSTMEFNQTGTWRHLRPYYQEKLAPCRGRCPAGTDLPRFISRVAQGDFREACRILRRSNPLSTVCGHVCYHPCQSSCTRALVDQGIEVQSLERFVSERFLEQESPEVPDLVHPVRVAVVGSGPAGLTAAYFLALKGVRSTVFDRERRAGGMLRVGIPRYRLPRNVLDAEIDRIRGLGVTLQLRTQVGQDVTLGELKSSYDAVFVATGAHRSRRMRGLSGRDGVLDGLAYLRRVNLGESVPLGRRVMVVGGGNTAMDVARTALRFGSEVVVVYRRTRTQMPAHESEVCAAEEEGVRFLFLASPLEVSRTDHGVKCRLQKMTLGPCDSSGRARPEPQPGAVLSMEANTVILAVGEDPELSFLVGLEESPGVFLGGDAATGSATVIDAVASGKRAVGKLLSYLRLDGAPQESVPEASFEQKRVRAEHFVRSTAARLPCLPVEDRQRSFDEVVGTLDANRAIEEAARCISCGVCTGCDRCWAFCPDAAVIRLDGVYSIDLNYCKGCGICVEECPRGLLSMIQEAP